MYTPKFGRFQVVYGERAVKRTGIEIIIGETISGTAPNTDKRYNMKVLTENITALESENLHSDNISMEQVFMSGAA
jgi:hypothetical protein